MTDYTSSIDQVLPSQSRVNGAAAAPPAQAAQASNLSDKPGTILADPAAAAQVKQNLTNSGIVATNPKMAQWSSTADPAHLAASQDQFPWMDKVSNAISGLVSFMRAPHRDIPLSEQFGAGVGSAVSASLADTARAISQPVIQKGPEDLPDWVKRLRAEPPGPFTKTLAGVGEVALAPWSALTAALSEFPGKEVEANLGVRHELVGAALSMLTPLGVKLPKGKGAPLEGALETPKEPPIEGEFREVPKGQKALPSPAMVHAEDNASVIDALHEATQNSELHSRSPAVTQAFLRQQLEGTPLETTSVPVDKALEVYQKRGIVPHEGDGVLGWVPNIGEKLREASATGGDISVPTAEYLTHVDEEAHAAFSKSLAIADHLSVDDAKAEESDTAPIEKTGTIPKTQEEIAKSVDEQRAADQKLVLERAKQSQYLRPLFTDAKSAGMSEEQFKLYSAAIKEADDKATSALQGIVARDAAREQGEAWKTGMAEHEPEARKDTYARPDVAARNFLATGKMPDGSVPTPAFKVSTSGARQSMPFSPSGKPTGEALPEEILSERGKNPDEVAPMFGYASGDAMLRDIANLHEAKPEGVSTSKDLERLVQGETRRRVAAEQGDFRTPEALLDAAREAVRTAPIQGMLIKDLQILAKQAGLPFDKAKLEARAEELFSNLVVKDALAIKNFEKISGRNGRQAEVFLLKGRAIPAFQAKQRQVLNQLILDQAHKFVNEFRKADRKWTKFAKNTISKSIGQEFMDQIRAILPQIGYPLQGIRNPVLDLLQFAQDRSDEGYDIKLFQTPGGPIKQMKVSDFRGTRDMLASLETSGKIEQSILRGKERVEFQSAINAAHDQFLALGDKHLSLSTLMDESAMGAARRAFYMPPDGPIRNVSDFIIDKLDAHNPNGVYNEVVTRPIEAGKHKAFQLLEKISEKNQAFEKTLTKPYKRSLDTKVDLPETDYVDPDGERHRVVQTKRDLLGVALHWGNEENIDKLLRGYVWNRNEIQAALEHYMTPDDWKLVQHYGALSEDLFKEANELEYRTTGSYAKEVKPQPFVMNGIKLPGWYWPAIYDERLGRSFVKEAIAPTFLGNTEYYRATPPRGYTQSRTGYAAPLNLDLTIGFHRLYQMAHDIGFREPLRDIQKFLSHPDIKRWVTKTVGPDYQAQFQPWLKRIAGTAAYDMRAMSNLSRFLNGLRRNLVYSQLCFRTSTVALHLPTAALKSTNEIGAKWLGHGSAQYLRNPFKVSQQVLKESTEMRMRSTNFEREARDAYTRIFEKQKFVTPAQQMGFLLIGKSDWASAVPTYLGAKEKALSEGESEAEAIERGEKAVRRAHGTGHPVDLPNLLDPRGGVGADFMRFMTMYSGFMNNTYNVQREIGTRPGNKLWGILTGMSTIISIGLWDAVVHGKDTKDESWEHQYFRGVVHALSAGIPLVRNAVDMLFTSWEPHTFELDAQLANAQRLGYDVKGLIHGKPVTGTDIKQFSNLLGATTGLPGSGQAGQTGAYLWDLAHHHEHPRNIHDLASGVLFGGEPKK